MHLSRLLMFRPSPCVWGSHSTPSTIPANLTSYYIRREIHLRCLKPTTTNSFVGSLAAGDGLGSDTPGQGNESLTRSTPHSSRSTTYATTALPTSLTFSTPARLSTSSKSSESSDGLRKNIPKHESTDTNSTTKSGQRHHEDAHVQSQSHDASPQPSTSDTATSSTHNSTSTASEDTPSQPAPYQPISMRAAAAGLAGFLLISYDVFSPGSPHLLQGVDAAGHALAVSLPVWFRDVVADAAMSDLAIVFAVAGWLGCTVAAAVTRNGRAVGVMALAWSFGAGERCSVALVAYKRSLSRYTLSKAH